jgi:glycerol-3-phosphate cytidylyltransferase
MMKMETYMKEQLIGYTTGVFDMFHIGHLNILKNAKSQCDHLIVGVSTDELVKQYKNKKPIIPFEERIEIVKSIKYVDEVVPQISMDKRQAWETLHYNVLFHGSDWKGSEMYDKVIRDLEEVGVKVVFLPHTQGVSSTLLADVLYKQQAEELH